MNKVLLTNNDLEVIKTIALTKWRNENNQAIETNLYTTACIVEAFVAHLNKNLNLNIELVLPKRQQYSSIDEE